MRWTKACTIESSAKLIRGPRIPTGGNTVRLGAHVSISESIALAPVRGRSVGCETIQIFSRSPRMLRKTKTIPPEVAKAFQDNMAKGGLFREVIENTAGQGTVVGHSFAQLAEIIKGSSHPERLTVCIDTCHTFAAGYEFRTPKGYEALFRTVDETVGLSRVRAFHLNDSKGELACHADRHEDIGKGKLGKDPFRFLVNDERFRDIPGILEFPGTDGGYRRELKLLRSFVTGPNPPTSPERPRAKRAGRGTA